MPDETELEHLTDAEPEEEVEEQEAVEETADSGDGECVDCDNEFIQFVKEQFGEDLSHYGNDVEAIKGLINARKAVGRKDTDAKLARTIRAKYGDEFLEKLLEGRAAIPQEEKPPKDEPNEQEIEFDPAWLVQVVRDENGKLVPAPGAPPDVVDKLLRFVRHREEVMNVFAKNPARFIESIIGPKLQQAIDGLVAKRLEEMGAAAMEHGAVSQWASANRELLFEGGDVDGELTELGKRVVDLADSLMADGISSAPRALQRAWSMIESQLKSTPKQVKSPSTKAMHVPAKKAKQITVEDLIEQGYGLADAYKRLSGKP